MLRPRLVRGAGLLYLLFVVYGSLVPLDLQPMSLQAAVEQFRHIPFLALGVGSRADWIANGVLYLPLGALTALTFGAARRPLVAGVLAWSACALVAVGVEFAQQFFPPRTVSQNDLLAEALGSALGAALAPLAGQWGALVARGWRDGGVRLQRRLLELYGFAYLATAFFPYDLLLSAAELRDKAASPAWGWLLAEQERGLGVALLLLPIEAALVAPLGGWLAARGQHVSRAALTGLLAGLLLEVGQFFIASGSSQGLSVVSRALGFAAGAWLAPRVEQLGWSGVAAMVRRWRLPLWALYLPTLVYVNGWFRGAWLGFEGATETWQQLRWLPFYYHYYLPEARALYSLGSTALMYLPAAVLALVAGGGMARSAAVVVALCAAVEAGKLFVAGLRPDPTNLLIAAAVAAGAATLSRWRSALRTAPPVAMPAEWTRRRAARIVSMPTWPLLGVPLLAVVTAAGFPAFPWALAAGIAAAAIAVAWRPSLACAIVPAALPVLDLAAWSGRLYWDEFDLLMAACLAALWWRTRRPEPQGDLHATCAAALLTLSFALSALLPLLPWPGLDDNSFSGYHSAFNGLRIAKGAAWAGLCALAFRRLRGRSPSRWACFEAGMLVGLAATVAWVFWERATFAGLTDMTAQYRVSGPFSAMHKGGAYVECYLAVGAAFAASVALRGRGWTVRIAGLVLLAAAAHAVMITYSRNGYVALAVALLLVVGASVWRTGRRHARLALAAALTLSVVAAAVPVLLGAYAQQRLAQSRADLALRWSHWADAVQLRSDGPLAFEYGEGLGGFPRAHYWRSREQARAASYAVVREGSQRFLRLAPGAQLYVEQVVHVMPGEPLRLALDLRVRGGAAEVSAMLCEKAYLASSGCVALRLVADAAPHGWRRVQAEIDSAKLGIRAWGPPVKLALLTPAQQSIDIDNVSLLGDDGAERIANGSFDAGMDRWLFSTDVDPPWHIHSLPVTVWFEQGWFGVFAWSAVLLLSLARGARALAAGDERSAAMGAACAFLASASVNTLIDAPRFLWLLLVLLALCASPPPRSGPYHRRAAWRRRQPTSIE